MVSSSRTVKGKHVLITGGAGFIGSHLVDLLIAEGVGQLTIIDNFFLGFFHCHFRKFEILFTPSTNSSISDLVLYTENEARTVPSMLKRSIKGCVQ